ncbi:MAG TPA: DUF1501 domain-containing protein [Polyangiaceae bacterium]|nr:DUF1501 domain-containing protein [Polyangiaceae bacterium]
MIHRRHLLTGSLATLGLALAGRMSRDAHAQSEPDPLPVQATSLIVLWMNGGASHIDTFDPKKGRDAGPFKAIATKTPGLEICEHLPQIAAQSDKLAVVRSVTSKEGNHQRARQLGHTGYVPNPTVAHPSLGAWVSHERGAVGDLPAFVSVGGPSHGAGFLGVAHGPFVHRKADELPADVTYGFGVDAERFTRRREALAFVESRFQKQTSSPSVASRREVYGKAARMMHSAQLKAFDLSDEPQAVRDAYGDSDFGRGCLLARRLVEARVPVVEVTLDGWDTHFDNFGRSEKLMADLDPAMATLVRDLAERDLLDRTLVVWMGDFGRTPRINGREGRDHHPRAQSVVLAGGGIRGGIVHGATDDRGDSVVSDPVTMPNLFATLAWQLGVDPSKTLQAPGGRPIAVTDGGSAIRALLD